MTRPRALLLLLAAAAATALLVSGCGGGGSKSGVAQLASTTPVATGADPASTQPSQQDFQTAILSYTKCLRSHGLNVPDPTFGGGGQGGGAGIFQQGGVNRNDPKFRKAQTACRSKLAGIRGNFDPAQRQKFQDAALKFAQCMRKNGVDVPDPSFSGGGRGGGGLFGSSRLNQNDPKVQKAEQACRSVFTNAGLGGPGGRGFGRQGAAP